MTNLEYFEMVEKEGCGCTPEYKNCMYMRSIARSLAVIADKLTSNETMTPNDFRQFIGLKPVDDSGADEVDESYYVKKVDESYYVKRCSNCKYYGLFGSEEPCKSCFESTAINTKWEPKEPTLKEATEHMQSEFDVTGKDVRIFMDHRVKPGCANND